MSTRVLLKVHARDLFTIAIFENILKKLQTVHPHRDCRFGQKKNALGTLKVIYTAKQVN